LLEGGDRPGDLGHRLLGRLRIEHDEAGQMADRKDPRFTYAPPQNRALSRSHAVAEKRRQRELHRSSEKFAAQRAWADGSGIHQASFNTCATELARCGVIRLDHSGKTVVMRLAS